MNKHKMESRLSVLLYSKYSATSKKLMDIMEDSGVNFSAIVALQPLCIDNEKVRNKIIQNQQINVSSVPCILVIFTDGVIEKYDGAHAFNWIEQIIVKHIPHPPPQTQPPLPQQQSKTVSFDVDQREQRLKEKERYLEQKMKEIEYEKIRDQNRQKFEKRDESNPKEHRRQRIIPKTPSQSPDKYISETTAIDDLRSDDDNDKISSDRYRQPKPVGRILENSGNYVQDDNLFKGTPPNMRKAHQSAVKGIKSDNSNSTDIMSKAQELAKGREIDSPPGHPANIDIVSKSV